MVNEQAEIALLLLTPIILLFILFDDLLIKLMYSSSFLPVVPMLFWSSIGILFKSSTWSMGYIFLAKSHSRLFFINELIGNVIFLVLNYFGYKLKRLKRNKFQDPITKIDKSNYSKKIYKIAEISVSN
jgi:O-antigen/teichoic acid export membrane protein